MSRSIARVLIGVSLAAIAGTFVATLGACNTVKGVGTDIHNVGQAGSNAISGNRSNSGSSGSSGGTSTSDSSGSH